MATTSKKSDKKPDNLPKSDGTKKWWRKNIPSRILGGFGGAVVGAVTCGLIEDDKMVRNNRGKIGLVGWILVRPVAFAFSSVYGFFRGAYLGAKYPDKILKIPAVLAAAYSEETTGVKTEYIDGKMVRFREIGMRIYESSDDIMNETDVQTDKIEKRGGEIYEESQILYYRRGSPPPGHAAHPIVTIQNSGQPFNIDQNTIDSINAQMAEGMAEDRHQIIVEKISGQSGGVPKVIGRNPLLAMAKFCPNLLHQPLLLDLENVHEIEAKQIIKTMIEEYRKECPNVRLPLITVNIGGTQQKHDYFQDILKTEFPEHGVQYGDQLSGIENAANRVSQQPPDNQKNSPPLIHSTENTPGQAMGQTSQVPSQVQQVPEQVQVPENELVVDPSTNNVKPKIKQSSKPSKS